MSAKRTESFSAAAARRSYENLMLERAVQAEARPGASELVAARKLACEGSEPGAFSAVACITNNYSHELGMFIEPTALRPLPRAVLVHAGHDITNRAVAVGVPTFADGAVQVDCVFASSARDAWARVQSGEVRSTSIYARCLEFHRGVNGRLVKGALVAVDLVRCGADPKAHITRLVAATELTPGQRQVQERLDRYLADRRIRRASISSCVLTATEPVPSSRFATSWRRCTRRDSNRSRPAVQPPLQCSPAVPVDAAAPAWTGSAASTPPVTTGCTTGKPTRRARRVVRRAWLGTTGLDQGTE